MKIVLATHNTHKTEEIATMIGDAYEVTDLRSLEDPPHPEETGTTFEENAAIKALATSERLPDAIVLADDSGIEADALDRAPGVYSARYAGIDGDQADDANNKKLLTELDRAGAKDPTTRTGRFRCVITVARNNKVLGHFHGTVEGWIGFEERGTTGFGYDPLFFPEGHDQTFAELGPDIKHTMSHRHRALEKTLTYLKTLS